MACQFMRFENVGFGFVAEQRTDNEGACSRDGHGSDARAGNCKAWAAAGNSKVTGERHLASTGHAETFDRGDHWLAHRFQRRVQSMQILKVAQAVGRVP